MARKTKQEFIEQAQQMHGDRFDYSEVEYVNTHTPVRIKCRQCGVVFLQEPASHLSGRGCPKCARKQTHLRVNQEQYIERAKAVHGNKYDYSKTAYVNMHTKITAQYMANLPKMPSHIFPGMAVLNVSVIIM